MGSRLELHEELLGLVDHAYFQPPESMKLEYPCIVYSKNNILNRNANNEKYMLHDRYELILIYSEADSYLPKDVLTHFRYCTLNRHFVTDNLYHDAFNLYY